ncbi:MAG: hypothetical protein EOO85_01230 [Pedobacter sp.]|nr:MAG: hypothetical protein EOO85_01230 [Pedobacter sp.]
MDRKIAIKKLASRVNLILPHVASEDITEDALVMPFLQILGFDADKVRADTMISLYSLKKNKRPSYAVFKGGKLNMLVECAHHEEKLEDHQMMLKHYWQKARAKYAMLTNGIEYRVYSSAMMRLNDFSKPMIGFSINKTHAGTINRMLNEHKELLSQIS